MREDSAARAYDAIAPQYDELVEGDEWIRRVLWSHYARLFRAGDRVLDVACGTGLDAAFLADRGVLVKAVDISPGMIGVLRRRVEALGLERQVDARVADLSALQTWPSQMFDGVVSAFAGLNVEADLGPFAASAAALLRPRGRLVVHLVNRVSLWECFELLRERRWAAARRLYANTERTFVIGGIAVRHYPFSPDQAYRRFFAGRFLLRGAYGLGILRPPPTVRRVPEPVVALLAWLERGVAAHRPFNSYGRFFVLDLEKRT